MTFSGYFKAFLVFIILPSVALAQSNSLEKTKTSLMIQDGHSSDIIAMAPHPFLNRLATLDNAGGLVIWDMNSRMILEKHHLGSRAANANSIDFTNNGRAITINTFWKGTPDFMKDSYREVFSYNLEQKVKYTLQNFADLSDYNSAIFFAGINQLRDYGDEYDFYAFVESLIGKIHKDSSQYSENQFQSFNERLIDVESDSTTRKVALTFLSGKIMVLDQELGTLWTNEDYNEIKTEAHNAVIKESRILGSKYLGYLLDRNGGSSLKKDYIMKIRDLENGDLVYEYDVSAEGFTSFQALTVSDDGKYVATFRSDSLIVVELDKFKINYSDYIPLVWQKDRTKIGTLIKSISFLPNSHDLAISVGNALFTYNPESKYFTSDFNNTLRPKYGGEISLSANHRYSIFNKRENTLDIFNLSNFNQHSYNSSFFYSLIEGPSAPGTFRLPMERYNLYGGIGDFLSYNPQQQRMSIWVVDEADSTKHHIITFDANDWSVAEITGNFYTGETTSENTRKLAHYDEKNKLIFITDSSYFDYRGNIMNVEVIKTGAAQPLIKKRKISHLSFSDNGQYWGFLENKNKLLIYTTDGNKKVLEKNFGNYGDYDSPTLLFTFSEDSFYYTDHRYQDSINTTKIMEMKLGTNKEKEVLDLQYLQPYAMEADQGKLFLSLDVDVTSKDWNNPDSLQQKLDIHGNDYLVDYNILVVDLKTGEITGQIHGEENYFSTIKTNDNFLLAQQFNGPIQIHRFDSLNSSVTHFKLGDSNLFTDYQNYTSSKELISKIGLRIKDRVFRVEEFDFIYNRPDILIRKMGSYEPAELEAYELAVKKRLQLSGIDSSRINKMLSTDELPVISLTNPADIEYTTAKSDIELQLEASGKLYPLKEWNLVVNGVSILAPDQKKLNGEEQSWKHSLTLDEGINEIKITTSNELGITSAPINFTIEYASEEPQAPDLYIVTLGVSQYENELYNLKYADKDAKDLQKAFSIHDTTYWSTYGNPDNKIDSTNYTVSKKYMGRADYYNSINRLTFTNQDVKKDVVSDIQRFLRSTKPGDVVLVFLAGHGTIDNNGDYYFATHDIDFTNPSERGLSYNSIQSIFEGINSRKRVLFMDTCHSGDLDPDLKVENQVVTQFTDSSRISTNMQRNIGQLGVATGQSEYNSYQLMKEVFSDFNSSGTIVISAASATGFAYETPTVQNGVFTHSIIKGLTGEANNYGWNGISISDLRNYIFETVELLTNGRQQPTVREENLLNDFRIW